MLEYIIQDETVPAYVAGSSIPKATAEPKLDISSWDRIHVLVGNTSRKHYDGWIQVTLGLPIDKSGYIPIGGTFWMEGPHDLVDFQVETPPGRTSACLSIPVVAPVLWKLEVANKEPEPLEGLWVAVFKQEI